MSYEFTYICYIRFGSCILALIIAAILLKKIKSPGAIYLLLQEVMSAIWAVGDSFETAATDLSQKLHWAIFSYLGVTTCAVFFLLFALQYSYQSRSLNKFLVFGLFIIPVVTMVMALTNNSHSLLWSKVIIDPGTNNSIYFYGSYFWVHTIFEYTVLTLGFIVLLTSALRVFSIYSAQFFSLIIALVLPFISSILYVYKLLPFQGIDPTSISFIISGIIIAINLYKFKLLDILPFARKQVINNIRDGLFVIDANQIIIDFNPVLLDMLSLNKLKIYGKNVDSIFGKFKVSLDQFQPGNNFMIETSLKINGQEIFYEIKCHPVLDRFNKEIGKMFLISDITPKKKLQNELIITNSRLQQEINEKNKVISDLEAYTQIVAHDLKNPIGTIYNFSDLLESDINKNDSQRALEHLKTVMNLSLKMIGIIDSLLILSRIRKEEIQVVNVSLKDAIDETLDRLKHDIESTHTIVQVAQNFPEVLGNKQWIEEVLYNLISNAIKYGGKPPVIDIWHSHTPSKKCQVYVQDNGPGLPPDSLGKLFRDFERLGRNDIPGHGLGLSIVKRVIEKMGGETKVESSGRAGDGCIFSFILGQ